MITHLIFALCACGLFFTIFGMWVFIMLLKGLKAPADKSNRFNRIRLFWFALTRPEIFAPHFDWMRRDEWDNVK